MAVAGILAFRQRTKRGQVGALRRPSQGQLVQKCATLRSVGFCPNRRTLSSLLANAKFRLKCVQEHGSCSNRPRLRLGKHASHGRFDGPGIPPVESTSLGRQPESRLSSVPGTWPTHDHPALDQTPQDAGQSARVQMQHLGHLPGGDSRTTTDDSQHQTLRTRDAELSCHPLRSGFQPMAYCPDQAHEFQDLSQSRHLAAFRTENKPGDRLPRHLPSPRREGNRTSVDPILLRRDAYFHGCGRPEASSGSMRCRIKHPGKGATLLVVNYRELFCTTSMIAGLSTPGNARAQARASLLSSRRTALPDIITKAADARFPNGTQAVQV